MSRAAWLNCQHERPCALVLTLFLFQKGQGFFPPLPIAALLRRSRRGAYAPLAELDASMRLENFAALMNGLISCPQWTVGKRIPCRVNASMRLWLFCNAKGQREVKITLAFLSEP